MPEPDPRALDAMYGESLRTEDATLATAGVDDIARFGRVLDPAPDDRQARAVRDMFAMMGEHPRLDTAAIHTVGTTGWDGFAVALIRP